LPKHNYKILIENTPEYDVYVKIPHRYIEKNNLEFKNATTILNEIGGDYLMLDAYYQGVWVPKNIIQFEKVKTYSLTNHTES
jgi:hypothetical protein